MNYTLRFRLLELSIGVLCVVLVITGLIFGIFLLDQWERTQENIATWEIIMIFAPASWIIGVPLLVIAIIKHQRSELTNPTWLTKLYFRRRDAKQCSICKKHPVSKKYHLKNEHKMKDFNVDDYFVDCGCAKCAIYNKSAIEGD